MKSLLAIAFIYLVLLTMCAMPAGATPAENYLTGFESNFNSLGEYSPRKRCREEAKYEWKRCRERDRRSNEVCDRELDRRKHECDRLPG